MGLLSDISDLGPDVTLDELLKRFAPSDADLKTARGHAWIQTGLGILANAGRVPTLNAVGQGGLMGLKSYNDEIGQLQGQGLRNMAGVSAALGVQDKLQAMRDRQGQRKILMDSAAPIPTAAPSPESLPQLGAPPPAAPPQPQMPGPPQYSTNFSGGQLTAKQKAAVAADIANNGYVPATAGNSAAAEIVAAAPTDLPPAFGPIVQKRAQAAQILKTAQNMLNGGFPEAAQHLFDQAQKMLPESAGVETVMYKGRPIQVQRYKDGSMEPVQGFEPTPKVSYHDTGSGIQAINDYTQQAVGSALPKSQTPDSLASNQVTMRGQNMTDARARELQAAGEIKETPEGLVRIGKDNAVTPIVAGGAQVQGPPSGAIKTQMAANSVMLDKLNRARSLIKTYPDAFGVKNYAPDAVVQRADPQGVAARALVADIGGQRIHDRAGASQTVTEVARLKPYIPNLTDSPSVVNKKLDMFEVEYSKMQRELAGGKTIEQVNAPQTAGGKTVVRTGTDASGKRVAQYSDGTIGPAP